MSTHDAICRAQNAPPLFPDAPYVCICATGAQGFTERVVKATLDGDFVQPGKHTDFECPECHATAALGHGEGCSKAKGKPTRKARAGKEGKPKAERVPNPCVGSVRARVAIPVTHYRVRFPFSPSNKGLAAYAASRPKPHELVISRDTGGPTFDDDALRKLRLRYPADPLYPKVEEYRILQKALGTYLAKLRESKLIGQDGRLHDRFRHTPKTFRLAMELLQVLPRPVGGDLAPDDPLRYYDAIRKCFVPTAGHEFVGIDFANVEPRLVAYAARDEALLRATETSSHSWFAANVIGRPVDFAWSDRDIAAYYKELAKAGPYTVNGQTHSWTTIRNGCKAAVMTALNAGGAGEISHKNPALFPSKKAAQYYLDAFFALCPKVPAWQMAQAEAAEATTFLTTPCGARLHYYNLFDYAFSKSRGVWERKLSRTAKEAIGALHQHTGAMYIATAVLAFWRESPELAQYLRILIHDEIFGEPPVAVADAYTDALASVMERPHPLMPLWPEASALLGGATHLNVKTETKRSRTSWGDMA